MRKTLALAGAAAGLLIATPLSAHHSFAVFFDETATVTITGEVTEFRFRNPHGEIGLITIGAEGQEEGVAWKAETNAPVILRRRGWSADSLNAGDGIVITGWPARDGSKYMRMRSVTMTDGTPVGTAPFAPDDN